MGPEKVVPKKIAIVVHQEHSRPGRVGALPREARLRAPSPLPRISAAICPKTCPDYAGVVIFGGPMSANDCGTPGRHQVRARLDPQGGRGGRSYLGLCLGAQLLTRAARRPGRAPSRGRDRGRLCRRRADRSGPRLVQGADEGLPVASRGHDTSPIAASCWPPTTPIRCRASAAAPTPSASSSIPK